MIKELDTQATIDFVSRFDADEVKTVFQIGIITEDEMAYIRKQTVHQKVEGYDRKGRPKYQTPDIDTEKLQGLYLQFGLKSWKNFQRADGTEIHFQTEPKEFPGLGIKGVITSDLLAKIHPDIKMEIFLAIQKANTLTDVKSINDSITKLQAKLGALDPNSKEAEDIQDELDELKQQLEDADEKNSSAPSQPS